MVDRDARNKLAEQIRRFVAGLSDNFEFDDVVFEIKTKDVAVKEIRNVLWNTYDDFTRHKLEGKWALKEDSMDVIRRLILFLKSDYECEKPDRTTDWNLWPFSDKHQLLSAKSSSTYSNNSK